jgi:hypothetical protein
MAEPQDHPQALLVPQREYATATNAWLNSTVRRIMHVSDRIFASASHETLEEVPESIVQPLAEGDSMAMTPLSIEATGAIEVEGIVQGDLDAVHLVADSTAQQWLAQFMKAMFAHISDVCDRTGNTVTNNGDLVETYIAALEGLEMSFDEHGNPTFQAVAGPETAEKMRAALANMTPEQAERIDKLLTRKREEFYASRRSRRLPRLGY